MRRGKPLPRYTELRNTKPLENRSELHRSAPIRRTPPLSGTGLSRAARSAPMRRTRIKAKPVVRSREEVEARRTVRQRSRGLCEIGWACNGNVEATDYAHRESRAQGGAWDAANAGDACRACHQRCHAHPVLARRRGWMVRRGHDFRSIPVDHVRHGVVLLDSAGGVTPTTREAA